MVLARTPTLSRTASYNARRADARATNGLASTNLAGQTGTMCRPARGGLGLMFIGTRA